MTFEATVYWRSGWLFGAAGNFLALLRRQKRAGLY